MKCPSFKRPLYGKCLWNKSLDFCSCISNCKLSQWKWYQHEADEFGSCTVQKCEHEPTQQTRRIRCMPVSNISRTGVSSLKGLPLSRNIHTCTSQATRYISGNAADGASKSSPKGPVLRDFLQAADQSGLGEHDADDVGLFRDFLQAADQSGLGERDADADGLHHVPYISRDDVDGHDRTVHIETYGCQMNVSDTEIVWSILKNNGFQKADDIKDSDVVLLMTCSIREGAEQKIWRKLEHLRHMKQSRARSRTAMKIGILGCMAERLKSQILERESCVDVLCGPDAYRDLPRLLSTATGQAAVNVQLSLEETYADVAPVRLNARSPSAFVSITRGCDNMCAYCVVPFTRGRERSRPISSILEEVRALSDQGVKEVTLLGQNVNSYRDLSEFVSSAKSSSHQHENHKSSITSRGFSSVYKPRHGGYRFSDLLDKVSLIDPEMRIRFTSPHPKDFPDEVLDLIAERPNICRHLHLPAQSGSSHVLESMRRGYTREAYLDLVHQIRHFMPDVSLSSDFIAGFCGETEEDHELTVSLMKLVKYNFAFCFPYSMRQKTKAYHHLKDDVADEVKSRRHQELTTTFRHESEKLNQAQAGTTQLVLVEGPSKRSTDDLAGRNDGNTKVIFPGETVPISAGSSVTRPISVGDYVAVEITGSSSQVLRGRAVHHTGLVEFCHEYPARDTFFAQSTNF